MKYPILLFSGGLDSTAMLHYYLRKSHVDVIYIKGGQDDVKVEAELNARKLIIKELQHITGNSVLTDTTIDVPLDAYWHQAGQWIIGASKRAVIDADRHSHLAVGYVRGDSIIPYLRSVENAWYSMHELCSGTIGHESVEIKFPLVDCGKEDYFNAQHELYLPRSVLEYIWTCETPTQIIRHDRYSNDREIKPCGKCTPCDTLHNLLMSLVKDRCDITKTSIKTAAELMRDVAYEDMLDAHDKTVITGEDDTSTVAISQNSEVVVHSTPKPVITVTKNARQK